jgi:hypothetical protein
MLLYLIDDRYSCQLLCSYRCSISERIEFIVVRERKRERESSSCQKKWRSREKILVET